MSISQQIYNVGPDALQNYFTVAFVDKFLAGTPISIRVKNVTVPSEGILFYEVKYINETIAKPSVSPEITKELSFTFRVDRNWEVYSFFKEWYVYLYDNKTYERGADEKDNNNRADMLLTAVHIDNKGVLNKLKAWKFDKCLIKSIGEIPFDYTSGSPIELPVVFTFVKMGDAE